MPRQSEKKRRSDRKKKLNNNNRTTRKDENNKDKKTGIKYRLRSTCNKLSENAAKKRSQACGKKEIRVVRNRSVRDAKVQTFPIVIVISDDESTDNVHCQEKEQPKLNHNDCPSIKGENVKDVSDMDKPVAPTDNRSSNDNIGYDENRCSITEEDRTITEETAQEEVLGENRFEASTATDADNGSTTNSVGKIENDCLIDKNELSNDEMETQAESDEINQQDESDYMMTEMQPMDVTNESQSDIPNRLNTLENVDSFIFGNKPDKSMSDFIVSHTFGSKNQIEDCAGANSPYDQQSNASNTDCAYDMEIRTNYPGIFTESGQAFYDSKHDAYVEPKVIIVEGGSSAPKPSKLSWCSIKNMFVRGIYSQGQDNISDNKSEQ